MINTDLLLVSAESRGILERLPAICNTDNTLEVDDNANLIFQNGNTEINSRSSFPNDCILAVNGNLMIRSDTSGQTLETLRAVNVTGSLLCPASFLTCIKDLYLRGDLDLTEETIPLFFRLESLYVSGTLFVPENFADEYNQMNIECRNVKIVKEEKRRILENRPRVILNKDILTASTHGILIQNCAVLTIDENISPLEILDCVEIVNCARVDCAESQKAAVYQKSNNVSQIGSREENGEPDGMPGILLNLSETKMINADKYVL